MLFKNTLTVVLCLIALIAGAQFASPLLKTYEVKELQQDFQHWRNKLESHHPLLYVYTPKHLLDRYFDSMYNEIKTPMTELEFIRYMAPINAMIRDGHTYVIPGKKTIQIIREQAKLLPLELTISENKMYVVQTLALGVPTMENAEILSVNHVKSEDILKILLSNLESEGYSKSHAIGKINASFRFYYHLFFGFSDSFVITYKPLNSQDSVCLIKADYLKNIQQIRKNISSSGPVSPKSGLNFHFLMAKQTAILKINTFSPNVTNRKFKREIAMFFHQLNTNKTSNLIIDLRNNTGGNPYLVTYILRHVFNAPFVQAIECRVVKNRNAEEFYKRTKRKWYPRYGIGRFKPKKNNYKGNIYVLVNEKTFSSGVIFSSVLNKYGRARFIGSATGGNPVIMSGYLIKTSRELPHTRIQYSYGTLCTLYDKFSNNLGTTFTPEFEVENDRNDLLDTNDKVIEYTLNLINASLK